MNSNFLNIKWVSRRLKYLLLNPKYFYLYFYGKPEKVFSALTDAPESHYYKLREELDSDSNFKEELRDKTLSDFRNRSISWILYSLLLKRDP